MKRLSILMYHGLYATEAQRLTIDPIDRPYALSTETFARQLDLLAAAGHWAPALRKNKFVSFAHVFFDMNAAAMLALLKFAQGRADAKWEKT